MNAQTEGFKIAVGCEVANCKNCAYYTNGHDGEECHKEGQEHTADLLTFPFRREQDCWEPYFWSSILSEEVNGDTSHDSLVVDMFVAAYEAEYARNLARLVNHSETPEVRMSLLLIKELKAELLRHCKTCRVDRLNRFGQKNTDICCRGCKTGKLLDSPHGSAERGEHVDE